MQEQRYIDGFSQVHFVGGMVRIDTFVLAPRPDAEPAQEDAGQLIMTPQAFVGALNAMQQLAAKLAEAGVLQTQAPDGQQQ
ncbi:MAG: hypothetical protein IKO41_10040 [Lachnospiraceae bacterium]|nr:hypothetical protein [Lachnospiraceae bacterium]